ncbi:metalloendoproteinase 4-MMP-like [Primulina tabacum]|uniref:metalloendoproteinase 4-MMP-like n=1 Tax=Primulina tabacum TaxID=48773 RepID=UPI003F59FACA
MFTDEHMYSFVTCFFLLSLVSSPCTCHARTSPFSCINPKNSSITWQEFENFRDATRGNVVEGISELKKYFNRFGYIESKTDANSTDLFDGELENAITRYQQKFGLSINGKLDSRTLSKLISPRCGMPDIVPDSGKLSQTTQKYTYFIGRPRWGRSIPMTLTYAISPTNIITYLSMQDMKATFERAFSHWASVIPVTFVESEDYGFADIKIGFYSGDHGDGEAFDGVLGVLAHAFSPEIGRLHLDTAETWAVDFRVEKSDIAVDLESVVTHEIGHLLGLAHSGVIESVMYPSLKPREKKVDLRVDDIKGVQALYGSNPNFSFRSFYESEMASNDGVRTRLFGGKIVRFSTLFRYIVWLLM